MFRLLSFSLLLFLAMPFYGQSNKAEIRNQYHHIDSVVSICLKEENTTAINNLINSNIITIPETKTYLLTRKAIILEYIHPFSKKEDDKSISLKANTILNLYDSILSQTECLSIPQVKYYRYVFLSNLVYKYNKKLNKEYTLLYKKYKTELKSKGLKPERDGFGFGGYFIQGKERWIGLEFSLASYYQGVTSLENKCDGKNYTYMPSYKAIHSVNALTFSYSKGIESNIDDISFSFIDFNAPFVFVPAKFGIQINPETNQLKYYYRPSIGLSAGHFSASYSYNLMFSKSVRSTAERHMLYLKINYTLINSRYRTKKY